MLQTLSLIKQTGAWASRPPQGRLWGCASVSQLDRPHLGSKPPHAHAPGGGCAGGGTGIPAGAGVRWGSRAVFEELGAAARRPVRRQGVLARCVSGQSLVSAAHAGCALRRESDCRCRHPHGQSYTSSRQQHVGTGTPQPTPRLPQNSGVSTHAHPASGWALQPVELVVFNIVTGGCGQHSCRMQAHATRPSRGKRHGSTSPTRVSQS